MGNEFQEIICLAPQGVSTKSEEPMRRGTTSSHTFKLSPRSSVEMDPVTIITTVGFAIQTAIKLTQTLRTFLQGIREVDERIENFVREVDSLRGCLLSIESCMNSPTLGSAKNVRGEAQDLFLSFDAALKNCRASLSKLGETLDKARSRHVPKGGSLRRGFIKNQELKMNLPDIENYRAQIKSHTIAMQLALETITLWVAIPFLKIILYCILIIL